MQIRMNESKYNELSSLEEKREFVNKRLKDEFIIGEDFDGDLDKEIEVLHKSCNSYDYISLRKLFKKNRKCDECFRIKMENKFKETIKDRFELKSRYYGVHSFIKVLIKKCGHIQKLKPYSVLNAIKFDRNVECEICTREKKINTIKKHIENVCSYENKFIFSKLNDNDNTVDIIHTRCNKSLNFNYKTVIHEDISCDSCKEEDKQEWFKNKLRNKYNVSKDFTLYRPYIDATKPIYLEHKCGYIKRISVCSLELLDNIKCNVCELDQFNNTKELVTVLYKYTKGEFTPANDYIAGSEEIFLRRKECGHVFYTEPKPFFKNPICPKCEEEKEYNKRHSNFERRLFKKYGSEYTTATRYKHYKKEIELIHNTCGTLFSDIPERVLKTKTKEPCPVCNKLGIKSKKTRINRHLNSLYQKYQDEFSLTGEYIDSRTETTYRHNLCGCEFNATPIKMLKRKYKCKNCIDGVPIENNENVVLETC